MSTIAYATSQMRSEGNRVEGDKQTKIQTYVDILAALVPAEVLALHGVWISFTTNTVNGTTEIIDKSMLGLAMIVLPMVSILLFLAPFMKGGFEKWEKWDYLRMWIPPLAFFGWTMLQRSSAFDAVLPTFPETLRNIIPAVGAVILAALAGILEKKPT